MTSTLDPCLAALRRELPPGAVSEDEQDRAAHALDCWPVALKRRQRGAESGLPAAVVRPGSAEEVARVLRLAAEHGLPVTPWGAGSSVVGQPIPEPGGLSLDLRGMHRVLAVDEHDGHVRVQAGAMGHEVEAALNARGLTLNFSPQSLDRSTVGGWVATRATGQFSSRWGGIEHALVGLTVVLPTGEVVEARPVPRAATGPDLKQLFVGSEGTLGVVCEVVLRVYPQPEARLLDTIRFDDVAAGLRAMRGILRAGLRPFLLRLYDPEEAAHALREPRADGGAAMLVGAEGVAAVARAELEAATGICAAAGGRSLGPAAAEGWMARRYDFSAVEAVLRRPGGLAETIEVAHTWTGIERTHARLKAALAPLASEVLGHFSHGYPDGTSLYVILLGEADDAAAAEQRLLEVWRTAMEVCLETGAAIAHHHGVGQARLPWLRRDLGSAATVLDAVKAALDPAGVLAPGRLGTEVAACAS